MKLAVHIPVFGRPELTEKVIAYYRALPVTTVVVGEEEYECDLFVRAPNRPFGAKLNAGMRAIRELDVDGVICVGSDDLVSETLLRNFGDAARTGYTVGLLDTFVADLETKTAIHWKGYENHRKGETVGAGRCFTRIALSFMHWSPWDHNANKNMDYGMTQRLKWIGLTFGTNTMAAAGAMLCLKGGECLNPMSVLEGEPVEDVWQHFPGYGWEDFA